MAGKPKGPAESGNGNVRIVVVDDDAHVLKLMERYLSNAGFSPQCFESSEEALEYCAQNPIDCAIVDLMMPRLDGFGFAEKLKQQDHNSGVQLIMVSGKGYEADKRRAQAAGCSAYMVKPLQRDIFLQKLNKVLSAGIEIAFWGVRGTLPVSGVETNKFGGNTSCVSVRLPDDDLFIFDAGSGIRSLGQHLMIKGNQKLKGRILISHAHWDHINALPFFGPLYVPGNRFEILGPKTQHHTMQQILDAQMQDPFFPINSSDFGAEVKCVDLVEDTYQFGEVKVNSLLLTHPGCCLGYVLEYKGARIAYITDNELYFPGTEGFSQSFYDSLVNFVQGADALITDSTYFDHEYQSKIHWGHSCISRVVDLAHDAKVKNLFLFHHDPHQVDQDIQNKWQVAQQKLLEKGSETVVHAPSQYSKFSLREGRLEVTELAASAA